MSTVPTIAVLRSLGLGDFLTALPALRGIHNTFPDHRIHLYMPTTLQPLVDVARLNMEVVHSPRGHMPVPNDLPDIAINLHGQGPQSHQALLAAMPGKLIAFAHPEVPESRTFPQWRNDEHEVMRWTRLMNHFDIPANVHDIDIDRSLFIAERPLKDCIVVHPGASSPARRWPVDRWVSVVRRLAEYGEHIAITGDATERDLAQHIIEAAGVSDSADYTGTSLLELCNIVANASMVVCGDTGVGHLATALSVPSVFLFGPTAPALWGPPMDRPWNQVIWTGHRGEANANEVDAGLLEITPDDVLNAIKSTKAA